MFLRLYTLIIFFTIFHFSFLEAKPPQLTARDTRVKIEEILKAHVSHQTLTEEIVSRAIQNYIDELDPGKTYFLEGDIKQWTTPSQEVLAQALEGYKKEDFSAFEAIHATMLAAVERRNVLEKEVGEAPFREECSTL